MAIINWTQNDTLPAIRTWLYQGRVVDGALPIDVSAAGTSVRANIGLNGLLKGTIICAKAPGLYKGEDKRTGLWVVDVTTPPYNTAGAGGIVLLYPLPATFDTVGVYLIEYEIVSAGGNQTIFKTDEVHVRKQIG